MRGGSTLHAFLKPEYKGRSNSLNVESFRTKMQDLGVENRELGEGRTNY